MRKNQWYVFTGGPCSGKTTVLKILEKMGHQILYEVSRIYIEEELKKGKTLSEIRKNELEFQKKSLKMHLAYESKLPKNKTVFLDRAIPDCIAYYRLCGVTNDKFLNKAVSNCRYNKIFLFEMLDYQKDHVRVESRKEALLLEKYLEEAYKGLGFPLIKVPVLKIEDRVKFVLKHL